MPRNYPRRSPKTQQPEHRNLDGKQTRRVYTVSSNQTRRNTVVRSEHHILTDITYPSSQESSSATPRRKPRHTPDTPHTTPGHTDPLRPCPVKHHPHTTSNRVNHPHGHPRTDSPPLPAATPPRPDHVGTQHHRTVLPTRPRTHQRPRTTPTSTRTRLDSDSDSLLGLKKRRQPSRLRRQTSANEPTPPPAHR